VEIPGVSNIDFLRAATNAKRRAAGQPELDPLEFYAFVMPKVREA
jgi:Fe-S cluster assembly ATP-binding protein